jgi:hypothetical protein
MKLKRAILDVMSRDELKVVVDDLGLDGVDRRSADEMASRLSRSRSATPELLLEGLSELQVKAVCEEVGLSSTGRKGALGAPSLGDVDGGGELEIAVGTVSSGVAVYDLPGTSNARVLWGTGRGGLRRTGAAPGPAGPPLPSRFYTVAPCRMLDTRQPAAPLGGPAVAAGASRLLPLEGTCGLPPTALAISANATVVAGGAAGNLVLWAGDGELPGTSSISFAAGRVRANDAVIELARDGSRTIQVRNGAAAAVDLILDVNGYFQ